MNPLKKPASKWEQKRGQRYGKSYVADQSVSKKALRRAEDRAKEIARKECIQVMREPMVDEYMRRMSEDMGVVFRGMYLLSNVVSFARTMRKNARRYLAGLTRESIQLDWDARCLPRRTVMAAAPPRAVRL